MRQHSHNPRPKQPRPGRFTAGSRQNADWLLRLREMFAGRDPAVSRGKQELTGAP